MERQDESAEQGVAWEGEPAEQQAGEGWQAESSRSDGEALALHEI